MDVAVDAAGQGQQARCIDLARCTLNTVGDAYDAAITNADISPKFVAGRYDGAAANGEVKLYHVKCLQKLLGEPGLKDPAPT